uniref:Uncharacterized protein n=1 Tax=Arundo donax TaxID=35708 RepID=A0A0A9CFE1_ARUDO
MYKIDAITLDKLLFS